jgi:hypothetical protein
MPITIVTSVLPSGHIEVREESTEVPRVRRRVVDPGADLTGEPPVIVEAARRAWTPEVLERARQERERAPGQRMQASL